MPEDPPAGPDQEQLPHRVPGKLFDLGLNAPTSSVVRVWLPPTVPQLQASLPQYEVQEFIARGGMAAVYKGVQKSLERTVAIKVLPPGSDDEGVRFAERFKLEARSMAKFRHPGIVGVYESGETAEGILYFVMEFVDGTDVAHLLGTEGKLEPARAVTITSRVCDALAYAHEHGVIHRDIKPSNIMIEPDGTVKVADFGLAKVTVPDAAALTRTNIAVGTPDYIAPEATIPGVEVDQRADIYALGVMLYQMLTGKIPRGRFEMPSGIVAQIDPRLDAIIDRAMQTDREKRYATAAEMKAELDKIMTAAKPTDPASQGGAKSKGRTLMQPLALAVAVVVAAIATFLHFAPGKSSGSQTGSASRAAAWRDAFAESPLKDVVAARQRTAQGYLLPDNNHWPLTPKAQRSAAVRVRATGQGEKFLSLYIALDKRREERLRFQPRSGQWKLSVGETGASDSDLAAAEGPAPSEGQPHDLLFARIGGRLKAVLDGRMLFDEADPSAAPGTMVLDIFPDTTVWVDKVEVLDLDDIPVEAALKLAGLAPVVKPAAQATSVAEPRVIKLWDAAEQLPKEQGVRWEADALRLDGHALRYNAVPSRDAILRAEVRMNPEEVSAQFGLRYRPAAGNRDSYYLVEVNAKESLAILSSDQLGKRTKLNAWHLSRAYGPDEWILFELRAIGDEITLVADGQTLGTVHDTSLPEPGGVHFFATSAGCFRNIVYSPLDKPSPSTPSPSPPNP